MTDKFYNALGLCRRAGKLAAGHDEVKTSIRSGKASALIFASDASQRLVDELSGLASQSDSQIKIIKTDADMSFLASRLSRKAAVYSVTDGEMKNLVLSTIKEDSMNGTDQ